MPPSPFPPRGFPPHPRRRSAAAADCLLAGAGVLKKEMAGSARLSAGPVALVALALAAHAQAQAPAPAPAPTSDGTTIDQGIAYLLMLVALVLTYLIHPMDASSPYKLF